MPVPIKSTPAFTFDRPLTKGQRNTPSPRLDQSSCDNELLDQFRTTLDRYCTVVDTVFLPQIDLFLSPIECLGEAVRAENSERLLLDFMCKASGSING